MSEFLVLLRQDEVHETINKAMDKVLWVCYDSISVQVNALHQVLHLIR
jgi:hypothetical protein